MLRERSVRFDLQPDQLTLTAKHLCLKKTATELQSLVPFGVPLRKRGGSLKSDLKKCAETVRSSDARFAVEIASRVRSHLAIGAIKIIMALRRASTD